MVGFTTLPSAQINDWPSLLSTPPEKRRDMNTVMEAGRGKKTNLIRNLCDSSCRFLWRKWGQSGGFDRIQLKAVADKMMMNYGGTAEWQSPAPSFTAPSLFHSSLPPPPSLVPSLFFPFSFSAPFQRNDPNVCSHTSLCVYIQWKHRVSIHVRWMYVIGVLCVL